MKGRTITTVMGGLVLALVYVGSASAQPAGAVCELNGIATVTPGLGAAPATYDFRFDGSIPASGCPTASLNIPGAGAPIDCSGGQLVAVGKLDPANCLADQHTGRYAITGAANSVCNVGHIGLDGKPDASSPTLNGICVGALCAGRDITTQNKIGGNNIPAPTRVYAIAFNDPSDSSVITSCPSPGDSNSVKFQGVIAFDTQLF